MDGAAIQIDLREEGLPAQAIVHGQLLIHLPGVVGIKTNLLGSVVLLYACAVREAGGFPQEVVRHTQARRLAVEAECHEVGS